MTWALSGDKLSFTDFEDGEGGELLEWTGGPWRKIA